jgi:translation initiation factor 4E
MSSSSSSAVDSSRTNSDSGKSIVPESNEPAFHKLSNKWTLWAHLPHDTNWSASSYKKIYEFESAEEAIAIFETLPPKLVMNCMLFLMRKGIVPMWEDAQNRNGGCFSYKVANKEVNQAWKQLSYVTVGETISTNLSVLPHVNGITISPKKNFCIIKIWMANCNFQNAGIIRELEGITAHGCLFKKHTPEY